MAACRAWRQRKQIDESGNAHDSMLRKAIMRQEQRKHWHNWRCEHALLMCRVLHAGRGGSASR